MLQLRGLEPSAPRHAANDGDMLLFNGALLFLQLTCVSVEDAVAAATRGCTCHATHCEEFSTTVTLKESIPYGNAGEVFGGLHVEPGTNDADAVAAALVAEGDTAAVLQRLRGPWAAVHWRADARTLTFGRDVFGAQPGYRVPAANMACKSVQHLHPFCTRSLQQCIQAEGFTALVSRQHGCMPCCRQAEPAGALAGCAGRPLHSGISRTCTAGPGQQRRGQPLLAGRTAALCA